MFPKAEVRLWEPLNVRGQNHFPFQGVSADDIEVGGIQYINKFLMNRVHLERLKIGPRLLVDIGFGF